MNVSSHFFDHPIGGNFCTTCSLETSALAMKKPLVICCLDGIGILSCCMGGYCRNSLEGFLQTNQDFMECYKGFSSGCSSEFDRFNENPVLSILYPGRPVWLKGLLWFFMSKNFQFQKCYSFYGQLWNKLTKHHPVECGMIQKNKQKKSTWCKMYRLYL